MADTEKKDDVIIIKKYANRRLYNTDSSSYITLDHLAEMTRNGVDFQVIDAKSGADITHQILTQIIMDEEAGGSQMLPVSFLRDLIGMYGNSMQSMIPHYLEMSMQHFRENQLKMRKALEDSLGTNPLAKLAQQNMAMFQAATEAFMAARPNAGGEAAPAEGEEKSDELDTLRKQMSEMQKQLDKLGK
ncbi:polyhydroxyalkanoate synthesis repressor PhaR [Croceicoccus naphthovorans]|uniref:Polyhydroxyalkanoate synthesis repressor PhaR n=1 Tax=Croceicoccus naphthovorans TaxID=1348774 RepID=A0A0G3XHF0_9SPHN|nr:polyhydroxyalkanoate synthesis repressor PhaR [Croceicoccus naphthovorans]AKM10021.1 polyhydroxyalkanoate synthesis repressor PhaR [Croceicoccus naphthovorans]MBB3991098.1 polyhydroxyalkanoate synthesis repressor PhaR [Croceicoccus naphthovorans]